MPQAAALKVAHPLMLRAIAAAKKKNDGIDANKICDCLRCDFLPMEAGVSYHQRKLHQAGYFRELLASDPDIHEGLRPLLRLSERRWCG